jgi:hypothetical protein
VRACGDVWRWCGWRGTQAWRQGRVLHALGPCHAATAPTASIAYRPPPPLPPTSCFMAPPPPQTHTRARARRCTRLPLLVADDELQPLKQALRDEPVVQLEEALAAHGVGRLEPQQEQALHLGKHLVREVLRVVVCVCVCARVC